MDANHIITTIRAQEPSLRARGVEHVALFGSYARGDANPTSDIDILLEISPDAPIGIFEYVDIANFIEKMFPQSPVDVTNHATLKKHVRPAAERDAIRIF